MKANEFRFKIAFATNSGTQVDGHFGSCETFAIYQFDAQQSGFLETRCASQQSGVEKNDLRAAQLADCQLLYVASIGGPAAAKVIKSGIYPLKDPSESSIDTLLRKLQGVLQGTPPPWMAKLMGNNQPLAHLLEFTEG